MKPVGKTGKKYASFERVAYFSRKAWGYMELICSSRLVQNRTSVEIELHVKSLITSSSSYRGAQARLIHPFHAQFLPSYSQQTQVLVVQ